MILFQIFVVKLCFCMKYIYGKFVVLEYFCLYICLFILFLFFSKKQHCSFAYYIILDNEIQVPLHKKKLYKYFSLESVVIIVLYRF